MHWIHIRRAANERLLRVPMPALLVGVGALNIAFGSTNSSSPPGTPAAASAVGAQPVTLTVGDSMSFDPASIAVRADQPVQLTLQNQGHITHDFTLTSGASQPVTIVAEVGQTTGGTFTIDRPGEYQIVCSQPGHAAAGMVGTVTAS